MKYIKKFNENIINEKEIKRVGFLNSDLLSTMIIDNNKGSLYLFNWGSYGKIDNYFIELKNETDFVDIEDWLTDILRDYGYNVEPNVISIVLLNKADVSGLKLLEEYPSDEIGDNIVKINFKIK